MNPNKEVRDDGLRKLFERAFQKCRSCSHIKLAHENTSTVCHDTNFISERLMRCKCKRYIPSDNLEYLEWECNNSKKKRK